MRLLNKNYLHFELGKWYCAIYFDGTRIRFKFIGNNPPMVETEDGRILSLYEVTKDADEIYEV